MTKIKRGSIFQLNGNQVFVWHDKQDGSIVISGSKNYDNVWTVLVVDLKPLVPGRATISNKPKVLSKIKKEFKKELNVFYANETLKAPFLCDNCNLPLHAFSKFEIRCCIAHICPKSKFTSVSIHPMNKLFLCSKGGCHSKFDNSTAQERSEMPVYKLAIERFNIFKEFLSPKELIQAFTYLNIQCQ